jgi:hypothetical protein
VLTCLGPCLRRLERPDTHHTAPSGSIMAPRCHRAASRLLALLVAASLAPLAHSTAVLAFEGGNTNYQPPQGACGGSAQLLKDAHDAGAGLGGGARAWEGAGTSQHPPLTVGPLLPLHPFALTLLLSTSLPGGSQC